MLQILKSDNYLQICIVVLCWLYVLSARRHYHHHHHHYCFMLQYWLQVFFFLFFTSVKDFQLWFLDGISCGFLHRMRRVKEWMADELCGFSAKCPFFFNEPGWEHFIVIKCGCRFGVRKPWLLARNLSVAHTSSLGCGFFLC